MFDKLVSHSEVSVGTSKKLKKFGVRKLFIVIFTFGSVWCQVEGIFLILSSNKVQLWLLLQLHPPAIYDSWGEGYMKIILKCTKTVLLENKSKKYAAQNEQDYELIKISELKFTNALQHKWFDLKVLT